MVGVGEIGYNLSITLGGTHKNVKIWNYLVENSFIRGKHVFPARVEFSHHSTRNFLRVQTSANRVKTNISVLLCYA